ncbi:Disease resistance protein [Melia azedarach]|uniref:Disease resistance protein n=1 Tax=Melia azedarach TaxID=155640 RepID=A0ACC1XGT2_MELAZ|nr:Disease resistance protein [Melia azedarach]
MSRVGPDVSMYKDVLGKLTSLACEEISMVWGFRKDVEKLANNLKYIEAVLLDADDRPIDSHERRVWLENLKDVCYDAEDVLDEFEIEVVRRQVRNRMSSRKKVSNFFSFSNTCPLAFRLRMGHKIKEIRERLNEIKADHKETPTERKTHENRAVIIKANEIVVASEVIGREMEKEKIINLLEDHSEHSEKVSVIPIVGVGGVGKTAVAKLVYDDERVKNDFGFDLKMWVCVSVDLDLKQWIVKIIRSATSRNYSKLDVEPLQRKLGELLKDKKYLLVLDDVWSDSREEWIKLNTLLMEGSCGSKIIVTTRSHSVASNMSTVSPYITLGTLPQDVCLSLFFKCAFRELGQENQHPKLKQIGEDIVKKCGGIPLAVRTLGSLLYSSTDENEWKHVRDSEIWKAREKENEILPALKLSYDQLPSHLKRCFVYCSLFPKDFVFSSYSLPLFWMAHGLLQSPGENEKLETVSLRYLKELLSRCFFQDFEPIFEGADILFFKMHDIMHDLASKIAEGEFLIVDSNRKFKLASKTVRHLAFVGGNVSEKEIISDLFPKVGNLRTISFVIDGEGPGKAFVEACIRRFRCLRVLNLGDSSIEVLPKEIDKLKHLRFFTLTGSKLTKVPKSLCKLQSLQTFTLGLCNRLEELPKDMRYMIGLRAFAFTSKQNNLQKNSIGCLDSLRFLYIDNCCNLEYLFEDIDQLKALQLLRIWNCPSLISLPQSIKNLSSIENLTFHNCKKLDLELRLKSDRESIHHNQLSGDTTTRPHLKRLRIEGILQLVKLPQWLLEAFTNTLQILLINNCPNFIALPDPLQYLISLQFLQIVDCPKLASLPEDIRHLRELKVLSIADCPMVSDRCLPAGTGEDWPNIAHIPTIRIDGETIQSRGLWSLASLEIQPHCIIKKRVHQ